MFKAFLNNIYNMNDELLIWFQSLKNNFFCSQGVFAAASFPAFYAPLEPDRNPDSSAYSTNSDVN